MSLRVLARAFNRQNKTINRNTWGRPRFLSDTTTRTPSRGKWMILGLSVTTAFGLIYYKQQLQLEAPSAAHARPVFKRSDVAAHNSKKTGIWVTFGNGVYDVTEFVDVHPGGERILLAAGKAIDPYWSVFVIHQSAETKELLEYYRIGDLLPADKDPSFDASQKADPGLQKLFENDPVRDPSLIVRSARPCNAEAAAESLEQYVTPNDLFYVRNHLPVPKLDPKSFKLEVQGPGIPLDQSYTLEDLKKFPKVDVMATIQCAGNRRNEMHESKPVKGLLWSLGAIGNAVWSGVRLSDLIADAGYTFNNKDNIQHVHFNGAEGYGASIPVQKALDPHGDVILAYEMNGEPIPVDHGYPLRALVPGHVAARSVKWLDKIILSDEESPSHWQQRDYKGFSPSATLETSDYSKAQSIQEMPVQSAITVPKSGQQVSTIVDKEGQKSILVKGYAWSGGGHGINRVDVSSDGGKTWIDATLSQNQSQAWGQHWAWTKWQAQVPVAGSQKEVELVCKAVDSSYQSQPESMMGIYNVRGVLVNAWHRIKIKLSPE